MYRYKLPVPPQNTAHASRAPYTASSTDCPQRPTPTPACPRPNPRAPQYATRSPSPRFVTAAPFLVWDLGLAAEKLEVAPRHRAAVERWQAVKGRRWGARRPGDGAGRYGPLRGLPLPPVMRVWASGSLHMRLPRASPGIARAAAHPHDRSTTGGQTSVLAGCACDSSGRGGRFPSSIYCLKRLGAL